MLEHLAESCLALKIAAEMSKKYYGKKLVLTYSGGKDSDVMLHLAESCLAPSDFEVINNHTSVDAPQTVKHIRWQRKRLAKKGIKMTIRIPKGKDGKQINMTKLILKNKMPPTRLARYCCKELKETTILNRICALGVRADESSNRKGRDLFATRGRVGGYQNWKWQIFFG